MTMFLWASVAWFGYQFLVSVLVLSRKCRDDSEEQRVWLVFRTITALCEAAFLVAAWGLLA